MVVRCKHAGVDVIIAVAPERGAGSVAPDRIVIDVKIGERPEQRPDPSISAVAVSPPSGAAVGPAGHRRAGADPGTRGRVIERGVVARGARERARVQRIVPGAHRSADMTPTPGAAEMPAAMVAAAAGMCAAVTAVTPSVSTAMTTAMTTAALGSGISGHRQRRRQND